MRLQHLVVSMALTLGAVSPADILVRADAPTSAAVGSQAAAADRPSRSWRRAASANFGAVGDAPETVLREALTELELFRSAMFSLAPFLPTPRFRTETPLLILFRNEGAFSPYKPRDDNGRRRGNVGGYYMKHPEGAYMVAPAGGHRLGAQLTTVLHEYAHDVFHSTLGNRLPTWLDEGLAELCGSIGAGGDSQIPGRYLGRPVDWHVLSLRQQIGLPIADLLSVRGQSLMSMRPDDTARFYAKSWALVHYLLIGREDRREGDVSAFLEALKAGRSPVDAFREAFRLEPDTVDAALARYVQRLSFPAVRIEDPGVFGNRAVDTEPLLESEAEELQGRLLFHIGDFDEAGKRLSSAFARDPQSTATRLSLARYHQLEFRTDEAIELLLPVVESEPKSYGARVALGSAQQKAGRYDDALRTFTAATALAASASASIEAWYGLSLAALSLERTTAADAAMSRLQAIEPGSGWHFARAWDLWDAGRDAFVVAEARALFGNDDDGTDANTRAYAAFVGALSARRLGQTDAANDLLTRADAPDLAPWTRTVLTYLRGGLSERDFLSKAGGRGEETEARTYIGVTASLAGRRSDAVLHLTWVRDRGGRNYSEYDMARTELARLEASGTGSN